MPSRFVGDTVTEQPDPVDIDLDDVSRLHPQGRSAPRTNAARRVPVTITSPGSSRVKDEQYSILRGISKIIWLMVAS